MVRLGLPTQFEVPKVVGGQTTNKKTSKIANKKKRKLSNEGLFFSFSAVNPDNFSTKLNRIRGIPQSY